MNKTKVSARGQTVIPKEIRKRYGMREGIHIEWMPLGNQTIMVRKVTTEGQKKMSWAKWAKKTEGLHKEVWRGVDPVRYTHELWGEKYQ